MPQTGATRYQKFLKSERAKTKLKAKKDLPKGTNVTKTNFKIKKIIIREQLRAHGSQEALSKRKLNTKELINKLGHFNTKSRTDALDGLRELVTSHSNILQENISLFIRQVSPLILDIEKVVRHEALKFLHLILSNTPADKLEPFFDIMCTYLRSAMTHIDNRIQEDSLMFLDVLLLCTPNRVAKEFYRIIPNFMDMISKLRIDAKPGRTLTVNMDSQMTSLKWRVKVLNRLKDFLTQFVKVSKQNKIITTGCTTHYFMQNAPNIFPLFSENYVKTLKLQCFSSKLEETAVINEVDSFQKYIDTLMPLLFETWIEAKPSAGVKSTIDTVLSEEAAALLAHTLEVIYLLWEYVKELQSVYTNVKIEQMFIKKTQQKFNEHIVSSFPYYTNLKQQRNKSVITETFQSAISDPKMVKENLKICYLFAVLNPNFNMQTHSGIVSSVVKYVDKTFTKNMNEELNTEIMQVMNCFITSGMPGWTKNLKILEPLFMKLIAAYSNTELPTPILHEVFSLLCKIGLNPKLIYFHKTRQYQEWMQNLPDILTGQEISVQAVDILHKFSIQNLGLFNKVMQPKLELILKNLPKLKIVDGTQESQFKLLSLLYRINNWNSQSLDILQTHFAEGAFDDFATKFLIDILRIKSEEKPMFS